MVLDIHLKDFETIKAFDFCAQSGYECDVIGISIFTDDETKILVQKLHITKFIDKADLSDELIPAILELCKDDNADSN